MKENNYKSFIVLAGTIILGVFTFVVAYNILPRNKSSDSYYVKVENDMTAKIEKINVDDGKLSIITSGNPIEYCLKTTRSTPSDNSLCWKKLNNNEVSVSIYQNKKYYVWIKDNKGNVSNYLEINSSK